MLRLAFALLLSGFALGAAASEPQMRSVSGQITVLERMALPDDTVLIVDVTSDTDTPVTGLRRLTEGAQSPFEFVLEVPADQALVLRAGLRGLDDMVWLSEPFPISPADTAMELGSLRAARVAQMGFAGLMSCGNQLVEIGFLPEALRIRLNEQTMTLQPQPAASGALYVDPDNPATTLHMKADAALLRIDGSELSECTLILPDYDITQGVWNISAIEDTPALFPSRTELVFYPDGRMTASMGCNRLIGNYRRHGGFLSFGRLASTRMACPDGMGEQEQRFSAILPKVDGYVLDPEAGRLMLTAQGQPILRARR
ncbi:MAG: META domain-containing protein [Roseinatronobacter sp.]|nr:META domain-containing protein [Roseinatronobacter sp.]